MDAAQIKHMVDRFLGWRLPKDFRPDNGIAYSRPNYALTIDATPSGTNLFDADQATAMVRHMVEGLPSVMTDPREKLAEEFERLMKRHRYYASGEACWAYSPADLLDLLRDNEIAILSALREPSAEAVRENALREAAALCCGYDSMEGDELGLAILGLIPAKAAETGDVRPLQERTGTFHDPV